MRRVGFDQCLTHNTGKGAMTGSAGIFIRTVDGRRGNGAVQDVINVMMLQGEALGEAAANFVQRHHGPGWER